MLEDNKGNTGVVMPPLIDLTSKQFTRLIVVRRVQNDNHGHSMWLCKCDCGKEKIISGYSITSGHTRSCGCFRSEKTTQRSTKHGHKAGNKVSKIYMAWESMVQRCTNSNDKGYKNYGGRGIVVCVRWMKFDNFLIDIGEPPTKHHSIDRIKNNGNYCKSNCRWATKKQQMRNMRTNHLVAYNGKKQCIAAWMEETGISENVILWRLKRGWPVEDTLTTPIRGKRKVKR